MKYYYCDKYGEVTPVLGLQVSKGNRMGFSLERVGGADLMFDIPLSSLGFRINSYVTAGTRELVVIVHPYADRVDNHRFGGIDGDLHEYILVEFQQTLGTYSFLIRRDYSHTVTEILEKCLSVQIKYVLMGMAKQDFLVYEQADQKALDW